MGLVSTNNQLVEITVALSVGTLGNLYIKANIQFIAPPQRWWGPITCRRGVYLGAPQSVMLWANKRANMCAVELRMVPINLFDILPSSVVESTNSTNKYSIWLDRSYIYLSDSLTLRKQVEIIIGGIGTVRFWCRKLSTIKYLPAKVLKSRNVGSYSILDQIKRSNTLNKPWHE